MPYLKIDQLTVRYPFQQEDVLKDVDVTINSGETVLILGPSGGGKSTLALTLNGIIPRSMEVEMQGSVTLAGETLDKWNLREISQRVGILFQDPETQFCMQTVEDEILFGLENLHLSKQEMDKRLERSLRLVGLTDWRKASLHELSGGMKQKVGIACLVAMDPEVFILDEPTANLDPVGTEEIFDLLISIARELNKTLIFIEHKLDYLLPHIERVIMLDKAGKIIADDSTRNIFEHHFSAIKEQGIWVPKICEYAKDLELRGMIWRKFPLSLAEWQEEWESQRRELPDFEIHATEEQTLEELQTTSPILQVNRLSFAYQEHQVLDNINFTIQSGDFVALLGQNGTGKSTLSQLLIGMLKPDNGKIYLNGEELTQLKTNELIRQVGFVFQNPEHQFVCDTVSDELAYGLKMLGWEEEAWKKRVHELLVQFGLEKHKMQNPFSLSQGQKRRLSVATMLVNDQQLLILDEPTFGQDHANTEALMGLLTELNQAGKTIVMITHDMELVSKYTNKVLLLHNGQVAYEGQVAPFFQEDETLQNSSIRAPISVSLQPWLKAFKEEKVLC